MPDWLLDSVANSSPLPPFEVIERLIASVLCGAAVAVVYRASHGRSKPDRATLTATLALLSILIALVSLVIGDSVARAFSLVGALSIVRFRTVVEDTRDTAFVIFAVIVGMASGAGLYLVPAIGIPIVGAVATALSFSRTTSIAGGLSAPASLSLRIGLGRDPEATIGPTLKRHARDFRVVSVSTARQGAALELKYVLSLAATSTGPTLVAELNQIEGVQSVDLRLASVGGEASA